MKERVTGLILGLFLGIAVTKVYLSPAFSGAKSEERDLGEASNDNVVLVGQLSPAGKTPSGGISAEPFFDLQGWNVSIVYGAKNEFGFIECANPIAHPTAKRIICDK